MKTNELETFLKKEIENALNHIENEENYYAMFKFVIKQCDYALGLKDIVFRFMIFENTMYDAENWVLDYSDRIKRAKQNAINTHKEWVTKFYNTRLKKENIEIERLICAIYNDIFD